MKNDFRQNILLFSFAIRETSTRGFLYNNWHKRKRGVWVKGITEMIQQDYLRYQGYAQSIEEKLSQLPKGNLTHRTIRGHQYCHLQFKGEDGKYHNQRIPEAEIEKTSQKLALRASLKEELHQVQLCITALEKSFPQLSAMCPGKMQQAVFSNDPQKCYRTYQGEYVRSKSELIIANELFAGHLSYEYEKPLELGGYLFHPDFTIYTPHQKQIVYWENCGLMNDDAYCEKWRKKKRLYEVAGITEWKKNLIVTYESQPGDLSIEEIHQHIQRLSQR